MTNDPLPVRIFTPMACLMLSFGLLFLDTGAAAGQQVFPVEGAPYSAGVTSPPGATLAVIGGIAGHGDDFGDAAGDALRQVGERLAEVGLGREDVLRVRAAIAPVARQGDAYAAWTEEWTAFFSGGHLPARTTVGASGLPDGALIVLDVVAAFPTGAGLPAPVDGARSTLNPNLRLAGPADNPTAIVSTRPGLFLSSGNLANTDELEDPSSVEQQTRSALNGLTGNLGTHGLRWADAFYVRVLPTPQPGRTEPDFAAWAPVYETLGEVTAGNAPPYSQWAAPGFSSSGRFVEVEVWAVPQAPLPVFSTIDPERPNPLLQMTGRETSSLSSGAWIGPNAELLWISGVIAPDGTAPEDEGAEALAAMRGRLEAMGASMQDVAELRVYRVAGEEGGPDLGDAFGEAYGSEFNNPSVNGHKPVRTNYLVESLPAGRHVEVEAIIVLPPRTF